MLVALALTPIILAQDRGASSQPSETNADGRDAKPAADPAKVFRDLERKLDVRLEKCDSCNARPPPPGSPQPPPPGPRLPSSPPGPRLPSGPPGPPLRRTPSPRKTVGCYQCRGSGKALSFEVETLSGPDSLPSQITEIFARPLNKLGPKGEEQAIRALNGYVAWCEAIDAHASSLAEKRNSKLRERVEGIRQQWFDRIRGGTEAVEVGRGLEVGRRFYADAVFTSVSRGVILGKKAPVGRAVAFAGKVDELLGEAKTRVASLTIESMDTTDVRCFVEVPSGVRWVPGARVLVVGRVIDPAGRKEILDRDANAVLVRPTLGTE
jgi:hypothetical protein